MCMLAAAGVAWFVLLHWLPVAGLIASGFCACAVDIIDTIDVIDTNDAIESVAMPSAREDKVCLNIGLVLVITYDGSQQVCDTGNQHGDEEEHQCVVEAARL